MTRTSRRQPARACTYLLGLLFLAAAGCRATGPAAPSDLAAVLSGAWQASSGKELLRFTSDRILVYENGALSVRGVVRYGDHDVAVRDEGLLKTWTIAVNEPVVRIGQGAETREYRRLGQTPPELELKPFSLGSARELPPARVKAIQAELALRLSRDQAVRKDPAQKSKRAEVGADNTRYLQQTVAEVGWIDVERFGSQTSVDAIILAQHSRHLALVMAVLPLIERDFKHPGDTAEFFAIVYDGLQLDLGGKQRYGTQLGEDAQGNPMVLPLDDRARVEQIRRDLGLEPLSQYLAAASQALFDKKPIRLPRDDE